MYFHKFVLYNAEEAYTQTVAMHSENTSYIRAEKINK